MVVVLVGAWKSPTTVCYRRATSVQQCTTVCYKRATMCYKRKDLSHDYSVLTSMPIFDPGLVMRTLSPTLRDSLRILSPTLKL
jgi:hypothetical protein